MTDPFASLNDQQRVAAGHDGATPLLIIAGAGTGKTSTLAARVAHLVLAGADPQRILLLTFSRRAAQELERRAGRILHQALGYAWTLRAPSLPWAGTFHGVAARLLREHAGRIGLADSFTIHDRADSEDLMAIVRQDLGFARTKNRFPMKATCLAIYSRVVNSERALDAVLAQAYPWCSAWQAQLRQLYRAYVDAKRRQQVLDYDDLLLYWSQMMGDSRIAVLLRERFMHVLVDEYQDTNRLQAAILRALKPDGRGLTVVGDDAQSIYSFRCAEVRNILDFATQFEPPARSVTLVRNYRSTQPILDACNALMDGAGERHSKRLTGEKGGGERAQLVSVEDETSQAERVADEVLRRRESGLALKGQAVLFRASHHSASLEIELTRRNVPFVKFGGLAFLEAAHIKDLLSLLRFAQNPKSLLAGFRVALLVAGIGPANARRLLDAMDSSPLPVQALLDFKPPASAAHDWQAFRSVYEQLRGGPSWPADLDLAIEWYLPQLRRLHDDAAVREADLSQLARNARTHPSRERFLAELTLDPPAATSDRAGAPHLDEDYLILSTMHSAKGQEWQAVYVLNVVDGCVPSDMASSSAAEVDEERRLLYVAMTRAKQHLALFVPQRFYVHQQSALGDRHVYATPSRFITPEVARCFEHVGSEAAAGAAMPAENPGASPSIDVMAKARALFD